MYVMGSRFGSISGGDRCIIPTPPKRCLNMNVAWTPVARAVDEVHGLDVRLRARTSHVLVLSVFHLRTHP